MATNLLPPHIRAGLYSIKDAARVADVKEETFRHNIERGQIPRPARRAAGGRRFYYTEREVAEIAKLFARRRRYKRSDE
jgi:DNA-binding transcriptional MerR regulator